MQLETRYARLGRNRIAYQTLGEGPLVLVNAPGSFSHADVVFEDPAAVLYYRRLASFATVIHFDRRGTGGSDPVPADARPPWELYVEELTAVLDAAGVERAAILARFDVGPMAISFAVTNPERAAALILANTSARHLAAADYPIGIPPEVAETLRAAMEEFWGTEELVRWLVPSRADDQRFRRWHAKLQRAITSPQTVQAFIRASYTVDARPLLAKVQAPTLVLHRRQFQLVPIEHGRYLAKQIPGAKLVELPGADGPLIWETPELALDAIEDFLTGAHRIVEPDRLLATVLFTDIVASTQQADQLGDRRWRELLDLHDQAARRWVEAFRGRLVKHTGDGILATFDSPARAILCAVALAEDLRGLGIQIRAGLHTGEIELRDGDVGGSPCTSPRGSWPRQNRGRSWCPGSCTIWWPGPASPFRTGEPTGSKASRASGSCWRWRTADPAGRAAGRQMRRSLQRGGRRAAVPKSEKDAMVVSAMLEPL